MDKSICRHCGLDIIYERNEWLHATRHNTTYYNCSFAMAALEPNVRTPSEEEILNNPGQAEPLDELSQLVYDTFNDELT